MSSDRFPSKVDWWLAVVLVIPPVAAVFSAFTAIAAGQPWAALPAPLLVSVIYGGLTFPLFYELTDAGLLLRHGLVRRTIPYAEIRGVTPTRNPLSSPALSLDRLHIAHGRWGTLISPRSKPEFLDALARRAPHLRREGECLVV